MGRAVFPPCYLPWHQTMVEVMKIMATSFKSSHARTATLRAPNPAAGHCWPTPLPETPKHPWASLGQSLVGSLLLFPGSWCAEDSAYALQECDLNVGAFDIVQRSLRLTSFLLIHFPLWFIYFYLAIFYLTDSIFCLIILLFVPSRVFFISFIALFIIYQLLFISSRSLLNLSCIYSILVSRIFICDSILFSRFWIIFTIIIWNSSGRFLISSSFVWFRGSLSCSFALLHSTIQGQICPLLQVFLDFLLFHSSPLQWKGHLFWVLVLQGLVGLHRIIQLQLLQHYWLGHRHGLWWYWTVCLGNEQRSFCRFRDCIQVLHFQLSCWPWWLLHFFWGIPAHSSTYNGHLS